MNGMVAPEVEKTLHGFRVSLPLYGLLVRYTANKFNDDPEGQMALVSTTRGRSSTDKAEYIERDGLWVTEKPCAGFLLEYGPDSLEFEAFEALLKASN